MLSENFNNKNSVFARHLFLKPDVFPTIWKQVLVSCYVVSHFTNMPTILATKIVMQRETNIPKNKFHQVLEFCLIGKYYLERLEL